MPSKVRLCEGDVRHQQLLSRSAARRVQGGLSVTLTSHAHVATSCWGPSHFETRYKPTIDGPVGSNRKGSTPTIAFTLTLRLARSVDEGLFINVACLSEDGSRHAWCARMSEVNIKMASFERC